MLSQYKIYIAPDCHECEYVLNYLKGRNIEIETQLLDRELWAEKGAFIFPALVKNEEIIAYGNDIIHHLVK